jgi:hypothetical protein
MAGQTQRRFALDSNILFDLAAEQDFAHTFREEFQARRSTLLVPPTVVQEITLKFRSGDSRERELAFKALSCMRQWKIVPYDLKSVGHGITEQFANDLIDRGLLPGTEFNDGLILAETALCFIPVLVTSDHHLLDIDAVELLTVLDARHLSPVHAAHPKKLLGALLK